MYSEKFAITEVGQVYRRDGHAWGLLGHIASVLRDENVLGRELRAWWQARLAAEEPGENIVVIGRSEPFFTNFRENGPFGTARLDQASVESALAAD